jgi:O-antigen ligase
MREILLWGGWLGLLIGWNMPNHYPLWTSFHSELVAAAGVGTLFGGLLWAPPARATPCAAELGRTLIPLGLPRAARVWLIIATLPLLQFVCGQVAYRGDAILGFAYGSAVGLGLYTGYLWCAQAGRKVVLERLFFVFLWASILSAGLALSQWLRLPPSGWWTIELLGGRPYGNLAQPNLFGLLMVMGIVAATSLFETRAIRHCGTYTLILAFLGFGLLISGSRAAALALLCIVALWFVSRQWVPSRLRVAGVLLSLAIGFLAYRRLGAIESFLHLTGTDIRSPFDVGARGLIWRHFAKAILAHPWLGYGFGQGGLALREVAAQVQPSRNTVYAHSFVLDLATWGGVPLALLLSAALAFWLCSWLRKSSDAALQQQRLWVLAIWLALVVQSLVEFPYAYTFFLLPAALLAGSVTAMPSGMLALPHRSFTASRSAIGLVVVVLLLLATITSDYFRFEDDFRSNRFERANFSRQSTSPIDLNLIVLDQLAALSASGHVKVRSGMPEEDIRLLEAVARRFHLLANRFVYAKALALNGRMAEADAELNAIRAVHHPSVYAQIERDWQAWLAQNPTRSVSPH